MNSLLLSLFLASLLMGGVFFYRAIRNARKDGENEVVRKSQGETLDNVEKAKIARDNLTPDERKRLQDKYSRE